MIDLGFLTEKEQEQILTVLKRDAELRKVDEERVKTLQRSVSDKRKLRYMSGEWFYKAKSRRHRDRIHGSDIVIASMRQTRKPMTILEQAQRRPERPSFVSSSNQDVHVPPELSGLIEEPHVQLRRDKNCNPHEETQQMFQPVSQSPTKQRQNPFNSELLATPTLDTSDEENGQSVNEPEEQTKTPGEETLPSSDSHICHATDLKRDSPENSPVTRDTSVQTPVTRRRTATRTSQDSPPEVDGPADRQANSAPRGILKRMSSSSSADSLSCWSPPQGPVSMDVPAGSSPDRRQVRFSSAVGRNTGEELGEHSLLDVDCVTPPVEEETTADSQNQDAGLLLVPGDQSENHSTELLSPQVANPLLAKQGSGHDDSSLVRRLSSKAKSSSKSLDNLTSQPTGHDDSRLVRRLSSKAKSSSKSLDNLTSQPTVEEGDTNDQSGPVDLSVDDASALPRPASPLSDPEQMKNKSVSVPDFHLEEGDSDDGTLEEFHRTRWGRRNTGSSLLSNTSLSSGMASMSSVSGSVMSIPAEVEGIEVQGTVQFAMNYVQKLGEFHIFVVHCRDLAVAEPKKNRSDPYVKCYLLPDKTKLGKRKTSVKKRTLNPIYNEIIRFKIEMESLKSQKLNISVWHNDNFGRNSFLGEVDLDLSEWNFSNTQIDDYALNARASAPPPTRPGSVDTGGEMRLALRFLPQMAQNKRASKVDETGEVQIWVKDCKNLPPVRGVIIDPFVKCTVLPDKSRGSRRKTRVVKRTANPMFNHTMVYDGFRPEDLREACVEITVWDHDRLQNHYIGGLRLGLGTGKSYGAEVGWMDSTTAEASLWERMMQSHAEWVEDVLPLRMLLMAKGMSK